MIIRQGSRKSWSALSEISPPRWSRTECKEQDALDACPWLWSQTVETVDNSKIILLCNAADRRSSSWQGFSSTSIWYIKRCSTKFSASIIMQCCALKMPPPVHNYETPQKGGLKGPESSCFVYFWRLECLKRKLGLWLKKSHVAVLSNVQRHFNIDTSLFRGL